MLCHIETFATVHISYLQTITYGVNLPGGWKTGQGQGMNLPSFQGNRM